MAVEITRPGKHSLLLETPVMAAAGTLGYGDAYRDIVKFEKLGAVVTHPVTYEPWNPASGQRVIPLDAGVLLHTGLPNPGLSKVLRMYRKTWEALPVPLIVHLVATTPEHVRKCCVRMDEEDCIDGIELGLNDDITLEEVHTFVRSAVDRIEKPVLVRLPLQSATSIAETAVDSGADALVISAPPRGTARDPNTGQLVSGRVYGPLVKPMVLRVVGQLTRRIDIPIIGAGGIHTPQDARDYIDAGARAVQVDTVTWSQPHLLETISRDLGGWIVTRESGAYPDEWHPGMGDTERDQMRQRHQDDQSASRYE